MSSVSSEIIGGAQIAAFLKDLADNIGDKLTPAARATAETVRSRIESNAPKDTGALAGSWTITTKKGEADISSSVPYAHRIEYGFIGTDTMGRNYAEPPRPYVQPALSGALDDFVERITEVFQ